MNSFYIGAYIIWVDYYKTFIKFHCARFKIIVRHIDYHQFDQTVAQYKIESYNGHLVFT